MNDGGEPYLELAICHTTYLLSVLRGNVTHHVKRDRLGYIVLDVNWPNHPSTTFQPVPSALHIPV